MKAIVSGILGQDGAYLAKYLLEKNVEVFGAIRPTAHHDYWRLNKLKVRDQVNLQCVDLLDSASITSFIRNVQPDYIFNLAAMSHVGKSFTCPNVTIQVNTLVPLNIFEAAKAFAPNARIYQASTSEMYGNRIDSYTRETGYDESDTFDPVSPYGIAKLAAHRLGIIYRHGGLWVSNGILFNHESPLRGNEFVTQKVCRGIANYMRTGKRITLGNIDSYRDMGHAEEYVDAMWRLVNYAPTDMVIATGHTTKIRDFIMAAATEAGCDNSFYTIAEGEKRPWDIDCLIGNPLKALKTIGWYAKRDYKDIAKEMMQDALAV